MKNCAYELMISIIKSLHNGSNRCKINNIEIWDIKYILNQLIRHIEIPEENYYISKEAIKLWEKLSKDNIWNYIYMNNVKYDFTDQITIPFYKGMNKKPSYFVNLPDENSKHNKFQFRSVFHDEHITDIISIIDKLLSLPEDEITYETIDKMIKNICVARILKEENIRLPKCNRGTTYNEAIKYYNDAGIELITKNQYLINRKDKFDDNRS